MWRSLPSCTLDNTLSNRLLGERYVGNYEHRYLSRGTIARLWGQSIRIVSNNRVRAVPAIAYCATDMFAKVYIDRYPGDQHNLKMTPNRLSFEQNLFIATDEYLVVKAIGVRWYRSIPIAQCKGLQGYLSMPIPNLICSQGYRLISTDNLIDL